MRFLLVKGNSILDRGIRWFTWGQYSHVAMLFSDDTVIEAVWPKVRKLSLTDWNLQQKYPFDMLTLDATPQQEAIMRAFAKDQVGKPYDWRGDLRFVERPFYEAEPDDKWFCSEVAFRTPQEAGINLLERIKAYKVSPSGFGLSPLLK